jgi:hypothetical protein
MNSIAIKSNPNDNCLTVHFLDKDGGSVRRAQFWNFTKYGEMLARVSGDWINDGLLPSKEEHGLNFF